MKRKAHRAMCFLVGEGVSLPRIACVGNCTVSSVRMFLQGEAIPNGAGLRFIIAAHAFQILRSGNFSTERLAGNAEADLAAFARRWLDKRQGQGKSGLR